MSVIISSGKVTVVKAKHGGTEAAVYADELDAVLHMINNGSLGGGVGYGGEEHKYALAAVEQQIAKTRAIIAETEAQDALAGDGH